MPKRQWERSGDLKHGSETSSNGSWRSQETVKQDQGFAGTRAAAMQVSIGQQDRYEYVDFFILILSSLF